MPQTCRTDIEPQLPNSGPIEPEADNKPTLDNHESPDHPFNQPSLPQPNPVSPVANRDSSPSMPSGSSGDSSSSSSISESDNQDFNAGLDDNYFSPRSGSSGDNNSSGSITESDNKHPSTSTASSSTTLIPYTGPKGGGK